jgi:predicted negative regulator of RcsB-dependent stress response
MTEDEQLEAIKKWWTRYQRPVTIVLSIVLAVVAGWRYWQWHADKVTQQASYTYEQLMMAFAQKDDKAVQAYAKQLSTEYRQTVYADVAHLAMAHYFVTHEQLNDAKNELNDVITHGNMPALQEVAAIRVARILISEKSYDAALNTLNELQTKHSDMVYAAKINELKGDIYAATGRAVKAQNFYQAAQVDVQKKGVNNAFLDMKIANNNA